MIDLGKVNNDVSSQVVAVAWVAKVALVLHRSPEDSKAAFSFLCTLRTSCSGAQYSCLGALLSRLLRFPRVDT